MTGGWGWEEDKNNKRWMRIRMRMRTMMRMWIRMKMRMRIRMRIEMLIKMRIRMREGWKKKYSIKLTKPLLGSRTRAQSRKRRNVNLKHHFCKNNFVHKLPIQDINIKQYFKKKIITKIWRQPRIQAVIGELFPFWIVIGRNISNDLNSKLLCCEPQDQALVSIYRLIQF